MLLIGSASAARTHGRKDPEQLYAYKAEADNIHDTLLPILKAQLAEIMSVPTPLVTSKHKVTHYAHAQHGPGFKTYSSNHWVNSARSAPLWNGPHGKRLQPLARKQYIRSSVCNWIMAPAVLWTPLCVFLHVYRCNNVYVLRERDCVYIICRARERERESKASLCVYIYIYISWTGKQSAIYIYMYTHSHNKSPHPRCTTTTWRTTMFW